MALRERGVVRQLRQKSIPSGVRFKLEGRWVAIDTAMNNLGPTFIAAYLAAQHEIAKKLMKIVKGHIYNQDLGWQELAESTKKNKGHDKAYIETGLFLDSIQILTKGTRVSVGIPRNIQARDGVYLSDIASVMEHGAGHVPARPLWEPSREEISRKYVNTVFKTRLGGLLLKQGIRPTFMQ